MSNIEDKRSAVQIGITLSSQLIAAALAMITIIGAFVAFVMDKKVVGTLYYIFVGCSFLSFIISIYFGGKGINQAREDGFTANWNLANTKDQFNKQGIFSFLGIILFIISLFIGETKETNYQKINDRQSQEIKQLKFNDSINKIELIEIKKIVNDLSGEMSKQIDTSNTLKIESKKEEKLELFYCA